MTTEPEEFDSLAVQFEGTVKVVSLDKKGNVLDETRIDDKVVTKLLADAINEALFYYLNSHEKDSTKEEG